MGQRGPLLRRQPQARQKHSSAADGTSTGVARAGAWRASGTHVEVHRHIKHVIVNVRPFLRPRGRALRRRPSGWESARSALRGHSVVVRRAGVPASGPAAASDEPGGAAAGLVSRQFAPGEGDGVDRREAGDPLHRGGGMANRADERLPDGAEKRYKCEQGSSAPASSPAGHLRCPWLFCCRQRLCADYLSKRRPPVAAFRWRRCLHVSRQGLPLPRLQWVPL